MKNFKRFLISSVAIMLLFTMAANAQVRMSTQRNIQAGEFIDMGGTASTGDTLQVSDTVAYSVPISHTNDVWAYHTWYWNKSGAGTAAITLSFYQSNDNLNWFPLKAGVAQTSYTKSYNLSASGWNEVSFARDTVRLEGRYLKIQYLTNATASVGGKVFTRVKTYVK